MNNSTVKKQLICFHIKDDYSGAPLVLSEVIEGLISRGFNIRLYIASCSGDGFLSDLKNVDQHRFFAPFHNFRVLSRLLFFISQFILFFSLLRYWRKDVVFYINTMWPFAAGLAGKIMNKKVVYHLHETSLKPKWLKRFLFRVLDTTASDVIYVSNYLKKKDPVAQTEPHVVHNALAPDFTANMMPNQTIEPFTVIMLCSLNKYKGIHEFVKLAARLSTVNFELVVSDTEDKINSYFKNIRFSENMTIFPAQKDVHPFYARASMVINLSHPDKWLETFGLTVLEAMHYGLPAIVPPNGGISELVKNDYNGYKISVKNLEAITEKIYQISTDHECYHRLSKNAKEMAGKFNYSRMIHRIIDVIAD
jgi:glycosyltransferase involved in cell wall biosynthesis